MDINELDVDGKNALALVYDELAESVESVPTQGLIYKGGAVNCLDLEELRFLIKIGSDLDLKCIEP